MRPADCRCLVAGPEPLLELAAAGWSRLAMDAVAKRAGVGKAALYRRWTSKEAMLLDLVTRLVRQEVPTAPDTGTLPGDVRGFFDVATTHSADPRVVRIAADLLGESARNPALAESLRIAVLAPRREAAAAILRRAVDRGELPTALDRELGTDLLISPLLLRLLIPGAPPVDEAYLDTLTDVVVTGLAVATPGGRRTRRGPSGPVSPASTS
ncbi:TetR/AcrR family transcriptional regulator [Streptomyces minutiscleroticus]|uniref:TetR/AcrR family transcriptional regulator n=1 Tax=Streptomyces minutiscleroticus TaxID=68238 RepID=UPI000AEB44C5|nr:TetR/AcrR family transcriptional regulator [Streptomyces minutiscleroticus]